MPKIISDPFNDTGEPETPAVTLKQPLREGKDNPKHYRPDKGLADAIEASLLLRRPLLLTGEPGTGKTDAARYLSWKLGYGDDILRFDAKSTSTARDLFYTYNTMGRFHAIQTSRPLKF
jgi:MoxR-like ATPase